MGDVKIVRGNFTPATSTMTTKSQMRSVENLCSITAVFFAEDATAAKRASEIFELFQKHGEFARVTWESGSAQGSVDGGPSTAA